jgi:beta-phosphoglucomutase-like phosphatase (HAD superfamily)
MDLPRRPAAVIFDLDGLLFDTESLYQDAIMAAAVELGHDMTPAIFHTMIGRPLAQTRAFLLEQYGSSFPVDELFATWHRHFAVIVETQLVVKPGVLELLDALDTLGLPRGIATSSSHKTVQHHLGAHGLAGRPIRICWRPSSWASTRLSASPSRIRTTVCARPRPPA